MLSPAVILVPLFLTSVVTTAYLCRDCCKACFQGTGHLLRSSLALLRRSFSITHGQEKADGAFEIECQSLISQHPESQAQDDQHSPNPPESDSHAHEHDCSMIGLRPFMSERISSEDEHETEHTPQQCLRHQQDSADYIDNHDVSLSADFLSAGFSTAEQLSSKPSKQPTYFDVDEAVSVHSEEITACLAPYFHVNGIGLRHHRGNRNLNGNHHPRHSHSRNPEHPASDSDSESDSDSDCRPAIPMQSSNKEQTGLEITLDTPLTDVRPTCLRRALSGVDNAVETIVRWAEGRTKDKSRPN